MSNTELCVLISLEWDVKIFPPRVEVKRRINKNYEYYSNLNLICIIL
jgi:hypothetical protein